CCFAALFLRQDAGAIASVSRALVANARAAFVPSSSVRNHMRSEQGKLYATRNAAAARRGPGACCGVGKRLGRKGAAPGATAGAASRRFGRLRFLEPMSFNRSIGIGW